MVLIAHIIQFQYWFGFGEPNWKIYGNASLGVTLFFVLSGYLITYLLLREKIQTEKIATQKFYVRRMLRIWPLYYVVLSISIFIIGSTALQCLPYYFFLLPNWAYAMMCTSAIIAPLWSVGVEEQFYLVWPLLVGATKKINWMLVLIIFIYFLIKLVGRLYGDKSINDFIALTRIDCMAIGGLGACWANSDRKYQSIIFDKITQVVIWIIFLFSCLIHPLVLPSFILQEVYAIVFILLILNVSLNSKTFIWLDNRILNWIGKISYGIYLWHMLILYVMSLTINDILPNTISGMIFYFVSCILLVFCVASISYIYFESYFINLKRKFVVVVSHDSK